MELCGDAPEDEADRSADNVPVCKFRTVVVLAEDIEYKAVQYNKHDDMLYRGEDHMLNPSEDGDMLHQGEDALEQCNKHNECFIESPMRPPLTAAVICFHFDQPLPSYVAHANRLGCPQAR